VQTLLKEIATFVPGDLDTLKNATPWFCPKIVCPSRLGQQNSFDLELPLAQPFLETPVTLLDQ
jgi:hypothetical protein